MNNFLDKMTNFIDSKRVCQEKCVSNLNITKK